MEIYGVILVILSLAALVFFAYRGVSIIILAPTLAVATFLAEGIFLGQTYGFAVLTETFMKGMSDYVFNYFLIFLLGAVFGKLMDATGCAKSIAEVISRRLGGGLAVMAVILSCALLTYGGVSLFVVVFAAYPIAASLFRQADIPRKFLPAAIAAGAFTFTMTALPGSPQIQNAVPMKYFGTDVYAAPILGIIASVLMFLLSYLWLSFRIKRAKARGEGYGEDQAALSETQEKLPSIWLALLPILLVLVINLVMSKFLFPAMDLSYVKDVFGKDPASLTGNWSLIAALLISLIVCLLCNLKRLKGRKMTTVNEGIESSFSAIMNTAMVVGYGSVIKTLGAFTTIKEAIVGISDNPLVADAVSTSVLAGVTGSASGGLSIALEALGADLMAMASAMNISPEVLHRIASIASGGLDTLPHNGAVITLLAVTGSNHKKSYLDICICTVVIPTITVILCILLGTIGVC